ncbi:MAG: TIGR01440 family protein [Clostridia bacterium]|nr:TIGR01440 family protein [Clostridia bacterium]
MNEIQTNIYNAARSALTELLNENRPFFNPVRLLAIGGSSSEMDGGVIGHQSTYELGEALAQAVIDMSKEHGFSCAFQCCEHLNRALVVERETAEAYQLNIVCVVPQPKAGGSLATAAYRAMKDPVVVEQVSADAAIDVGQTLIGMHLRAVAVPIRLKTNTIGHATVTAARTRPKLIGGERARYSID